MQKKEKRSGYARLGVFGNWTECMLIGVQLLIVHHYPLLVLLDTVTPHRVSLIVPYVKFKIKLQSEITPCS